MCNAADVMQLLTLLTLAAANAADVGHVMQGTILKNGINFRPDLSQNKLVRND